MSSIFGTRYLVEEMHESLKTEIVCLAVIYNVSRVGKGHAISMRVNQISHHPVSSLAACKELGVSQSSWNGNHL